MNSNIGRRSVFKFLGAASAAGVIGGNAMQATAARAASYANEWMRDAVPGNRVKFSGCVVRFSDPDGSPSIHANAAHISAGVKSVGIDRHGRLEVIQTVTNPGENPVIFAFCQTDETLSARGIIAGASGGTDDTHFTFFDTKLGRKLDLSNYNDRMRLQGKNSNVWLGWVHTTWA